MSNVYAAPNASLSTIEAPGTGTRILAWNGRIGRVRWIVYTSVMWYLVSIVGAMITELAWPASKTLIVSLPTLIGIVMMAVLAPISRRRLQDMGLGWPSLVLAVIPFLNLYFFFLMVFKRGDEGDNAYGPVPSPNNLPLKLAAAILPSIAVIAALFGLKH